MDDWIHTGDVAEIDSCRSIKIVDHVKVNFSCLTGQCGRRWSLIFHLSSSNNNCRGIMKLAQGEYVALEKIENLYSSTPIVAQIYVHGDSLQSFLVAVLVPDPIQLAGIAGSLTGTKVSPENNPALAAACKDERVVSHILSTLTKVADQSGLKGYASVIFSFGPCWMTFMLS